MKARLIEETNQSIDIEQEKDDLSFDQAKKQFRSIEKKGKGIGDQNSCSDTMSRFSTSMEHTEKTQKKKKCNVAIDIFHTIQPSSRDELCLYTS